MEIIVGKNNLEDPLVGTLKAAGFVFKKVDPGISWYEAGQWKVVDLSAPERAPDHRTLKVAFVRFAKIKGRRAKIHKAFFREMVIARPKTVFSMLDKGSKLAIQKLAATV